MNTYAEQLKLRAQLDEAALEQACAQLAGAVAKPPPAAADSAAQADDAIGQICRWLRVQPAADVGGAQDIEGRLDAAFKKNGVMRRGVMLEGDWWKGAALPLLASTSHGDFLALLPRAGRYSFQWRGRQTRVTRKNAPMFQAPAVCFYRPLPQRPMTVRELAGFLLSSLATADILYILFVSACALGLGMLLPAMTDILFSSHVPTGQMIFVLASGVFLLGTALGSFFLNVTRQMLVSKFQTKMDIDLQNALVGRMLRLPSRFFAQHEAGGMAVRLAQMNGLCEMLCNALFGSGLSFLFSLGFVGQIALLSPSLALAAAASAALQLAVMAISVALRTRQVQRAIEADRAVGNVTYSLFSGIPKIKVSGSEARAFAKWGSTYSRVAKAKFSPHWLLRINAALSLTASLIGMMIIYAAALAGSTLLAEYMAFSAAYGLLGAALAGLAGISTNIAAIAPILRGAKPLLDAAPESSENKIPVAALRGDIALSHVSFSYSPDMPLVLDDISFHIEPGQYVAIAGATGSGKSTVLRLLLGFEAPQTGAVFYDGADLQRLDMRDLRRHVGVVMQNDKVFAGDIYSNITVTAPGLNAEDTWQAATLAGIAEDIRAMPMGMHTVISEGGGGISGGQRQRLMIARAVASNPRVLLLDEATSALDNLTQAHVAKALDGLNCTRIVVAHRLSTIRDCDRILLLDGGKIAEDGSYDELMERRGLFFELVRRQQVEH